LSSTSPLAGLFWASGADEDILQRLVNASRAPSKPLRVGVLNRFNHCDVLIEVVLREAVFLGASQDMILVPTVQDMILVPTVRPEAFVDGVV
jgi:hypothetical protein